MARRRMRTNKKVPAKGRLRDMADKLWSLAVKLDWHNRCAACGRRENLDSHHLVPRQWEATRYRLQNGICLCKHCHQFDAGISPHLNAAGWLLWLEEHWPTAYEEYMTTMEQGHHMSFDGVKNPAHYVDVIGSLREYVEDEDYVRIVGQRFAAWLEEDE